MLEPLAAVAVTEHVMPLARHLVPADAVLEQTGVYPSHGGAAIAANVAVCAAGTMTAAWLRATMDAARCARFQIGSIGRHADNDRPSRAPATPEEYEDDERASASRPTG